MEETLRKLDELALELKLLTTEMREKGPEVGLQVKALRAVEGIKDQIHAL